MRKREREMYVKWMDSIMSRFPVSKICPDDCYNSSLSLSVAFLLCGSLCLMYKHTELLSKFAVKKQHKKCVSCVNTLSKIHIKDSLRHTLLMWLTIVEFPYKQQHNLLWLNMPMAKVANIPGMWDRTTCHVVRQSNICHLYQQCCDGLRMLVLHI
jgi:hypothetical protein